MDGQIKIRKRADRLTGAGLLLIALGGMAADSPGQGYLWAGLIVVVGLALAVLGQRLERRRERENRL